MPCVSPEQESMCVYVCVPEQTHSVSWMDVIGGDWTKA